MLFNLIRSVIAGDWYSLITIIMLIPIVLIALTVHECAHGYIAYKLGDPTAKAMGRLSLNPKEHLDPVGTLMMFLFGFGWAKPVPINPNYFKNRKRGMAITALAGPLSNALLSFVGVLIYHIVVTFTAKMTAFLIVSQNFLFYFSYMNLGFAIFNLIPIPPLDGSRVLNIILPDRYYFKLMQYERYIYIAVIILLFTGLLDRPFGFLIQAALSFFDTVVSLIPGIM